MSASSSTAANKNGSKFNLFEDKLKMELYRLQERLKQVYAGGGQKSAEKQKAKGKLLARERIAHLLDKDSDFLEIGALAAWEMYEDEGGCPSAGVVCGIGRVQGRLCMIVANDATVKAGAWFPMTAKKNLRAQEIAMENHIPIIYLVDSAGVYLPMQDQIFPDKEHFGRMFRNNARLSSMGIPQIAAVMGSCVAGGAYLPIMSDEALIVEGTGSIFLAGPYLVRAAIGEDVDQETLGGAHTHSAISGVTDYSCKNDEECLDTIRKLVDKLGHKAGNHFDRIKATTPARKTTELYGLMPDTREQPYDVRHLLECMVDKGSLVEYKAEYGQTLVCAYARLDGWSIGIVANQRTVVKSGKKEMQLGGVIYSDSADKAARFIMNCNQKNIPLVFLQDVTGFMVGSRAEHGGIIKDGAKLVNAVANSTVPKFTVIMGNSYGAGNYAMCGKAYDPRLIFAWPTARIAVMGGEQAAKTLLQIKVSALEKQGKKLTPAQQKEELKVIVDRYNAQTSPYYAAARLWVDGILDPAQTRQMISTGIEMAVHAPAPPPFVPGVLQT